MDFPYMVMYYPYIVMSFFQFYNNLPIYIYILKGMEIYLICENKCLQKVLLWGHFLNMQKAMSTVLVSK